MRSFLLIAVSMITLGAVSPSFAQVGSGPAPPTVAQPDKFPTLNWTASTTPSATYNAYRGITAGGVKGRINTAPIAATTYRDTTAAFGVQNFYTVTAEAPGFSESVPSNEASGTALRGSAASPSGLNAVVAVLIKVGKGIIYAVTFGRINLFG